MLNKLAKLNNIGVMDSGIGGLNVLNAIQSHFTKTNLVYLGDNKNSPYGNKSVYELKRLATNSISKLLEQNVKIIVVACNTLSTTVFDYIKTICPVPCVPTLPLAQNGNKYKRPTLISTPVTASSNYVKENFKNFTIVPLPFLSGEIERYVLSPNKISLEKDLRALPEDLDYLYLGCTHYVYLKDKIERLMNIKVEDNCESVLSKVIELTEESLIDFKVARPTLNFIGNSANYNYKVYKSVFGDQKTHKVVVNSQKI